MKLHHLRDLLAVADKGSINGAARSLGVTQPAVSRSIRELEHELGVPLFTRQSKGADLTAFGEIFVRRANAAVSELRRAGEEIDQIRGTVRGVVEACFSGLAQVALLPKVLKPFRTRYPDVQINLIEAVYPMVESRLKSGAIDLYVGAEPALKPPSDLLVERLFENTRIVVARKGHALAKATSLHDLLEADWVTTAITDKPEAEFAEVFSSHHLPAPRLGVATGSALSTLSAVAYSDMLSMMPRQWADSPLFASLCVKVPVTEHVEGPPVALIMRSAAPPTPVAEYLCNLLRRASAAYADQGITP